MRDYIEGPDDKEYDRTWTNSTDGQQFWGIDNGDGTTSWYDRNGDYDSDSDTPTDWEQDENDWNYG